ncbi:MAG: hypothetical protein BA863_06210 [Desulfovibrio sp. S3730MH75]|nr:MAG: hypothetical protein BA863_06210 [Desulfovibrio sp. S3730MH75]
MLNPQKSKSNSGDFTSLVDSFIGAGASEDTLVLGCRLACLSTAAEGVAILRKDSGGVSVLASWSQDERKGTPPWLMFIAGKFNRALSSTRLVFDIDSKEVGSTHGLVVPLISGMGYELALAAALPGCPRGSNADIHLQLIRCLLSVAGTTPTNSHKDAIHPLVEVFDMVAEVQEASRFVEVATGFCSSLAARFDLKKVVLGVVGKHDVKAVAMDQAERFSRSSRVVSCAERAMTECMDQDQEIFWPAQNESDLSTTQIEAMAFQSEAKFATCLPLRVNGKIVMVLLLLADGNGLGPMNMDKIRLATTLLTPRLNDLQRDEEWVGKTVWRHIMMQATDWFGPSLTALKLAGAIILAFFILSVVIPGDIEISAPLRIEGIKSYTHTAPIDSYLREVNVRPGDEVKAGTLLGRLDDTDIRMEIAALESEMQINRSKHFLKQQEGKTAESALALLEERKAGVRLKWAMTRLGRTELRAKVDGCVVSEDMTPRIGLPVSRGQGLFEVSDTKSLRCVLYVPEDEVVDIVKGETYSGEFALVAYPDRPMKFSMTRIQPFSEVVENVNSFEVQGAIDEVSSSVDLRPGMEGHAKLNVGTASLFYVYTRKLMNRLRMIFWKIG